MALEIDGQHSEAEMVLVAVLRDVEQDIPTRISK